MATHSFHKKTGFIFTTLLALSLTNLQALAQTADQYFSYSPLKKINKKNVGQLKLDWVLKIKNQSGLAGRPVIADNTLFLSTLSPNSLLAIDLEKRQVKWQYQFKKTIATHADICCTKSGGVTYSDGKVFFQRLDGHLVALDASSGKLLWQLRRQPTTEPNIFSQPQVYKNKVLVGSSIGNHTKLGQLAAFDAHSGKLIWSASSAGQHKDTLAALNKTAVWNGQNRNILSKRQYYDTWPSDFWDQGDLSAQGGGITGNIVFDETLDLIFHGTGAPLPIDSQKRSGTNLWTSSIIARDIHTGEIRWAYPTTPHDELGYGSNNAIVITNTFIHGKSQKILTQFSENGFAFTLDALTGKPLSVAKFDPSTNWAGVGPQLKLNKKPRYSPEFNGYKATTKGVCPSLLGATNKQTPSFDPKKGLFYLSTNHLCMTYHLPEPRKTQVNRHDMTPEPTIFMFPSPYYHGGSGNLIAWDPLKGKIIQTQPSRFPLWSGILATAGGIVCFGTFNGLLKCVDQDQFDQELFKFKTPSSITEPVFTYKVKGKQYLGVFSGIDSIPSYPFPHPSASNQNIKEINDMLKSGHTQLGGVLFIFSLPQEKIQK